VKFGCNVATMRLFLSSAVIAASLGGQDVIFHAPSAYPDPFQQWDSVSQILQDYMTEHNVKQQDNLPKISFQKVNMTDGVTLDTIIINPYPYDAKKPACVVRSPYGPTTENMADIFTATNGFVAILQDQRGTFTSGGDFNLWRKASVDARDTFNWVSSQDWSDGTIFSAGASADGIAEFEAVLADPPQLRGQWIMWSTGDGHELAYQDGAYRQDLIEGYMGFMSILTHGKSKLVIPEVKEHEPYTDWWANLTACRDVTRPQDPDCHYKEVKWPVLMLAGFWDIFQKTHLEAWDGIRVASHPSHREDHVLIVAPLGHCLIGTPVHPKLAAADAESILTSVELMSEQWGGNLTGPTRARIGRVNFFVMAGYAGGAVGNYWYSGDDFPTPTPKTLYLAPNQKLTDAAPTAAAAESYTYDPADPTPMLGGNNLPGIGKVKDCGSVDQGDRDSRDDVLVYETGALAQDLPVVGKLSAKVFFSSDAKDTDVVVTVSDVAPGLFGKKVMLVRYGVERLRWRDSDTTPSAPLVKDQVYEADIDLLHTAYIFPKGHHIRVTVASAATPFWGANTNTGEPVVANATGVKANNKLHLAPKYPSQLVLPVVDMKDIPENPNFAKAKSVLV